MRLLFIADARSPIARNWIRHFSERGDEVFIASTFEWDAQGFSPQQIEFTPAAFSAAKKRAAAPSAAPSRTLKLRTALRHWLGPLTLPASAKKLRAFIQRVQPDLIHAMRVPYEGMLAAEALSGLSERPPFIVSIWGNDFTLHAPSAPLMGQYTRKALRLADGLHADAQRDIRLAKRWGWDEAKPSLVAPGNGGVRADVFYPPAAPPRNPIVLNPRGVRPYVRNDSFFKAIPLVLEKYPDAKFQCVGMQNEPQAQAWTREFNIENAVELLPAFSHAQMGEVFRAAQIVVSPSVHDGTPNTLLEALACGCFPVAGDLESIREWITPAENGLLCDANSPRSIADAILQALENEDLRARAAGLNRKMISARAEYGANMKRAEEFYKRVIGN
ncbi:MAG: glycosyltransferase family 4 protein [Anaerolineales bacterium]|nr:glycosyltransferase family 4 protein [Anaerolineales bacterium]